VTDVARLARLLPDLPRWVETRGMLLSGRCDVLAAAPPPACDFLVRGTDFGLLCVVGTPPSESLTSAAAAGFGRQALCVPESAEAVAAALPGWRRRRFVILSPGGESLDEGGGAVEAELRVAMLSGRDAPRLRHLPEPLRLEIETALNVSHVAAAFEDDLPVSFCYSAYETETLWDVSIDTLEAHRRRGLARRCVLFLADHMERHGKAPVWGALAENAASRRLAESLGFAPVDEIAVFERTGPP
jgi:GNAT superfamily N-acetyltransferase